MPDERPRRVLEPLRDRLPVLDPSLAHPPPELLERARPELHAVAHDEALHADAVDEHRTEVPDAVGLGRAVLRDEPADRDARSGVHQRQDRVQHFAPDVLEVHVDALRRRGLQVVAEPAGLVVDAGVEPELAHDVVALCLAARNADHTATLELRELSDHAADRARSSGDDDGLARLRLGDVEQAHPGGDPGHAEHAERIRGRRPRGVHLAHARAVGDGVLLPAERSGHEVALSEAWMPRFDHLADRAAGHHLAELDVLRVRLLRVHAAAHVRVEREPVIADQELAVAGLGQRHCLEPEVRFGDPALRPADEKDLTICGHGRASRTGRRAV